ncbi:hypothetical protein WJX84_008461 [Apatococcus fuscideae]|uniref:Uncharacterized protein n=1 Tax=Apatococcus fuscideae TaxID=2026836 RepID=A0AAW1S341_9CHLO
MELDEADELNMAFSSDLQACKFVRTPDDLARLLSAADSYREELCQLSGTNQLELVQVLCRVAERLLTTGSITKDFHHLASLLRAATEHVHSVATGKHIGQFLQQLQLLQALGPTLLNGFKLNTEPCTTVEQLWQVFKVFDDWTFARDRRHLQASIGPVLTSLLPDSGKPTRVARLEDDGVHLILRILTNHATYQLVLQMLLTDRNEASHGLKGVQQAFQVNCTLDVRMEALKAIHRCIGHLDDQEDISAHEPWLPGSMQAVIYAAERDPSLRVRRTATSVLAIFLKLTYQRPQQDVCECLALKARDKCQVVMIS